MPFPRRWYRPASGRTGTLAHAVAGRGPESAASDSGHTGTAGCLKSIRPWPGRRQVALIGRVNQRLRISEEGFTGRCPPCLLGHRRVTRRSASPKLHKSLGHLASQSARRTGRERVRAEPRRITRTRPTSAPTNGWSRSSTSGISLTLVRWTEPGGASSPTISPPSPTEPGLSLSSGSRAPRRPRRPRRSRPSPPRRPDRRVPRARRRRAPGRPRPKSPLPRPLGRLPARRRPLSAAQLCPLRHPQLCLLPQPRLCFLPQPQLCLLPQPQLCFLPQAHPMAPRSAGCAVPRRAPSPT